MEKKNYAIFKEDKVLIDDEIKENIENAIIEGKKYIILNDKKYKLSDFIRFSEEESLSPFEKRNLEFSDNIRKRLLMSPEDRARETRGHFNLFFWAVFGKKTPESIWEKAVVGIEKYYEKHKNAIYPPLSFYFRMMPQAKERKIDGCAFRILQVADGVYSWAVDNLTLTSN